MTTRVLQVKLPDDLDAEVGAAIAAGEYASAEDAIVGAVAEWRAGRRLDASLDRETLRLLWREGIESGGGRGLSIDDLKHEARRRFTQG
jgi:Arc/MetJ-type ribon-helix-helix transcriptional regulator